MKSGMKQTLSLLGILTISLLPQLSATKSAFADAAEFRSHGFSDDERGRYFVFEEYGVEERTLFPYSNIYMIDLSSDRWIPDTPVRVLLEDPREAPLQARADAFAQITPIMQDYQISNSGVLMAANPLNEFSSGNQLQFRQIAQPLLGEATQPYSIDLEVKPAKAMGDCEADNANTVGFTLSLTRPTGEKEVLHEDNSVPESRGCPLEYRLVAVFAPTRLPAETYGAALVGVFSMNEGEQNLRYIAVPFSF